MASVLRNPTLLTVVGFVVDEVEVVFVVVVVVVGF
jgi:hypothetical protein